MASISKAAFYILIISMVNLSTHANAECLFVGGNFSHSCRNIRLLPDRMHLEATCGTPPNTSQLYLNEKVANGNSVLRCKQCFGFMHLIEKKCEFSQSCSDIQLHGTVLSATCINNNHQPVRSSVDLDDCVMNNRGFLDWVC
ncbi:hypothetical protein KP509_18G074200 [Ceratopteris richardii]|uniref:Cyanovirin-N domain-containing protein n=1 Tax=Ceratopteris richardii TaxID=49495 RepID=A0A8T2SSH4_CERRI|nr:hypothetical protein KP509_18G074200 [Ceratopteris richardii]